MYRMGYSKDSNQVNLTINHVIDVMVQNRSGKIEVSIEFAKMKFY